MNSLSLVMMGIRHIKDIANKEINSSAMETNEEIISRLKFIGYIQKDEKIDSHYVLRQPNTWMTSLNRSVLSPDNRGKSLKFLREVINRSFEILQNFLEKEKKSDSKDLLIDLQNCCNGLVNLKHTYAEDTKFCCDIDVLLQRIHSKLADFQIEEKEE